MFSCLRFSRASLLWRLHVLLARCFCSLVFFCTQCCPVSLTIHCLSVATPVGPSSPAVCAYLALSFRLLRVPMLLRWLSSAVPMIRPRCRAFVASRQILRLGMNVCGDVRSSPVVRLHVVCNVVCAHACVPWSLSSCTPSSLSLLLCLVAFVLVAWCLFALI